MLARDTASSGRRFLNKPSFMTMCRMVADLPIGWTDQQSGGSYRARATRRQCLVRFCRGTAFAETVSLSARESVSSADRTAAGWEFRDAVDDQPPVALLGLRACELAAIAVQDRTFLNDRYTDPIYRHRREQALLIAVNCTQAAATCFCTSMGTGPLHARV